MGWAEGQLGAARGKLGSVLDQHMKPVFTCSPRRSFPSPDPTPTPSHPLTEPSPRNSAWGPKGTWPHTRHLSPPSPEPEGQLQVKEKGA